MVLLHYIGLNIACLIKKHSYIFIMIIMSAMLTSLCLFFSYGLFLNTRENIGAMDADRYVYKYTLPGKNNLIESLNTLNTELGDSLDHIDLMITVKDKNGTEHKAGAYSDMDSSIFSDGRYSCYLSSDAAYLMDSENTVIFDGIRYKANVKNASEFYREAALPMGSLTNEAVGTQMMIYVKTQPTVESVDKTNEMMHRLFGAKSEYLPKARSLMDKQINNAFYVFSFVIVLTVVINLSLYFKYIISIRVRQIKVLMICGALRIHIICIQILEALLELLVGYIAALILYKAFLLEILISFYPSFDYYFQSSKLYVESLVVYLAGAVLVLIFSLVPYLNSLIIGKREE